MWLVNNSLFEVHLQNVRIFLVEVVAVCYDVANVDVEQHKWAVVELIFCYLFLEELSVDFAEFLLWVFENIITFEPFFLLLEVFLLFLTFLSELFHFINRVLRAFNILWIILNLLLHSDSAFLLSSEFEFYSSNLLLNTCKLKFKFSLELVYWTSFIKQGFLSSSK